MRGRPFPETHGRRPWRLAGATLLAAVWAASPGWTQTTPTSGPPLTGPILSADVKPSSEGATPATMAPAGDLLQAGCSTCGNGLLAPPSMEGGGCGTCGSGCNGLCVPGRKPCDCCCDSDNCAGRFFCGLYKCICCPDPCYDPPHWLGVADSAFFTDATRPITQMRVRWDSGFDVKNPDRGEYFWARQGLKPPQTMPSCNRVNLPGRGVCCLVNGVDHDDLSLYIEGATPTAGAFVEIPYREVSPDPISGVPGTSCCTNSGFADMNAGVKSLLLDCELIQVGLQFKTFIPVGSTGKGLGVGHVSLEPALLCTVKLTPTTYLQMQSAYWIPIAGNELYQANVWHNHFSLNHILWRPCHDVQVIGTMEVNEWSVYGGGYTANFFNTTTNSMGQQVLSATFASPGGATMLSAGPGIRGILCDKLDLGVGSAFALTGSRWDKELIRAEFRWRF